MALSPSNGITLEQLALKGLKRTFGYDVFGVSSGDDEETVELEDHVQTTVTVAVHDTLIMTCRLAENGDRDRVTWYRDRCVLMYVSVCCKAIHLF